MYHKIEDTQRSSALDSTTDDSTRRLSTDDSTTPMRRYCDGDGGCGFDVYLGGCCKEAAEDFLPRGGTIDIGSDAVGRVKLVMATALGDAISSGSLTGRRPR